MDIREFTTYNEDSPITGFGVWITVEIGRRIHLLHPVTLKELIVTEYEYKVSSGRTLWPVNTTRGDFSAARFMDSFKKRIAFFLENKRPFPIHTVAKVLAELDEITFEEALAFIGKQSLDEFGQSISRTSDKATRVYNIRDCANLSQVTAARPLTLIRILKENGPASISQLTSLADGKLNTKSGMSRVVTYFVNKLTAEGVLEIVA